LLAFLCLEKKLSRNCKSVVLHAFEVKQEIWASFGLWEFAHYLHARTHASTHAYGPVNPNQERQAVVAGLLLLELVVFLSQSRRGCKAGAGGEGGRERPKPVLSICDRIASVRRCWMLGVQNLTG
jgi:hypothetical protein